MQQECSSSFPYHASLPYPTESASEALNELNEIVKRISAFAESGEFQKYEFGTDYAHDAAQATRDLLNWTKRKFCIPLETRITLTRIYLEQCFACVEPALFIRYGTLLLLMWRSSQAMQELHSLQEANGSSKSPMGFVDYFKLVRMVRNTMIAGDSSSSESSFYPPDRLTGLGGSLGTPQESRKSPTPVRIAVRLARLFAPGIAFTSSTQNAIHDEILCLLGPPGHAPPQKMVLGALSALIPYSSTEARSVYIPQLLDLWHRVPIEVANTYIMPSFAEFAVYSMISTSKFDFTEILDLSFQSILHSMQIPLTAQKRKIRGDAPGKSRASMLGYDGYSFAKLVVWTLSPTNQHPLDMLASFTNAVLSFCHPSNSGIWTSLVVAVLNDIVTAFIRRMELESSGEIQVSAENKLTDKEAGRLVELVKPIVLMSVYSTSTLLFTQSVTLVGLLAVIRPKEIAEDVLREAYPTLQHGLHQPHRMLTSVALLEQVAKSLATDPKLRVHLTTILELTVPNLDTNDAKRCFFTMSLFQTVASLVEFKDLSDGKSQSLALGLMPQLVGAVVREPGTEISQLSYDEALESIASSVDTLNEVHRGTTMAFPDLLTTYMRRIFELLETSAEQKLNTATPASVLKVLLACSPEIFNRLLKLAIEEISNPQQQSNDAFSQVCGAFVRARPEESFSKFWLLLVQSIYDEVNENQAGKRRVSTAKDSNLLRYLSVLNMCLLAAPAPLLLSVSDELVKLLRVLREHTGLGVVYTVANTLHHALTSLLSISIQLPGPQGQFYCSTNTPGIGDPSFRWNTPSEQSTKLAEQIFLEHIELSSIKISEALKTSNSSSAVSISDDISTALIFIRTATGAVASIAKSPSIYEGRAKIVAILFNLAPKLSRDDISSWKEVLFVAKVWLCDVGYERTARLDLHQCNLYMYEKRQFNVPGSRKRNIPLSVRARRAQVFHHQLCSLNTQRQEATPIAEDMLKKVVLTACFSAYPEVRRNAFTAAYGPLKIFSNQQLYKEVYEHILAKTEKLLENEEFERAEGAFVLLKYRSFGMYTVGYFPQLINRFFSLCLKGAAVDHQKTSCGALHAFFALLPDVFRLGIVSEGETASETAKEAAEAVSELLNSIASQPLTDVHWRQALLRASTLLAASLLPQLPLRAEYISAALQGSVAHHPDVRLTAGLAALNMLQGVLRCGMVGYRTDTYRVDGDIEVPSMVGLSRDKSLPENDLSSFIKRSPLPTLKAARAQPRPNTNLMKFGAQAHDTQSGVWRVLSSFEGGFLTKLNAEDRKELQKVNIPTFWQDHLGVRQLEPRSEDDRLNRVSTLLLRDAIVLAQHGFGNAAHEMIDGMIKVMDITDKNWHRVAAEIFCALIMALPAADGEGAEKLEQMAKMVFCPLVIQNLSSETVGYWASALAFAVPNVDHQRIEWLLKVVEDFSNPHTSSDGGGIKLSLRTALHTEIVNAIGPNRNSLTSVVGHWKHWNHSLQTTRETATEEVCAAVASTMDWKLPKSQSANETTADKVHFTLSSTTTEYLASLFDIQTPKSEISLLSLLLSLLHSLGGDAVIDILISQGFPLLLKLSSVRDDPEVTVLVTKVFAELGAIEFTGENMSRIADLVVQSMDSAEQWHQRVRLLLFTQSFYFNHLLVLGNERRMTLANVAVEALADQQAEVRELAADTLAGIVRCSPHDEQNDLVTSLQSRFMQKIGRTVPLVERHAAVLGLGALITAFPYTSPPPSWIPTVLACIASRAAGDSGIVGKSAKQVLSDFKKTRQDTWHIDQLVFSQDQLDDLDGVLWRNYFA